MTREQAEARLASSKALRALQMTKREVIDRFRHEGGRMVECPGCESKLRRALLADGVLDTVPHCPLCHTSLLLPEWKEALDAAEAAYKTAHAVFLETMEVET